MTHPTDDEIMELAGSWFHTGENQKRDDGYYYRSLGTPSNVRGSDLIEFARALLAEQAQPAEDASKLWLWKNFVNGRPEYWAFDNPYPVNLDGGDPQTLGEPCGYAIFKPSRSGRPDFSEDEVLLRIAQAESKVSYNLGPNKADADALFWPRIPQ